MGNKFQYNVHMIWWYQCANFLWQHSDEVDIDDLISCRVPAYHSLSMIVWVQRMTEQATSHYLKQSWPVCMAQFWRHRSNSVWQLIQYLDYAPKFYFKIMSLLKTYVNFSMIIHMTFSWYWNPLYYLSAQWSWNSFSNVLVHGGDILSFCLCLI